MCKSARPIEEDCFLRNHQDLKIVRIIDCSRTVDWRSPPLPFDPSLCPLIEGLTIIYGVADSDCEAAGVADSDCDAYT